MPELQDGPDYPDGCSQEGFIGGCERMGCHKPEPRVSSEEVQEIRSTSVLNGDKDITDMCDDLRETIARITELEGDCKRLEKEVSRLEACRQEEQERLMELEAENTRLKEEVEGWKLGYRGFP